MSRTIEEIIATLPHRYPFLLVDRILEINEDSVVGLKNVTINEPFFQGHFPGRPLMPGVLIMEALAQTGGILAFQVMEKPKNAPVYFLGMDKVRFRRPVRPGDQLILKLKIMKRKGPIFKMKGEAYVNEQLVAEGELMATVESDAIA
ncbi:MAG: 3-hydroxyacyl-ACP dehydratase FabZ [Thermodesulfobacteriota bacterium]|jgi:beta-hydroxyacyl-ACP dehydratase FabZ|uniref:3-hydroxyacyl-[acyl-carrier-protein] dehydratase FabZ n=1 Tax=Desulfoglaeba alkanexedens ALDC TaxID=980445 RepID=A0A4P8L570_9BACT|nr:3-hydroxyacyl-ACP dehydratase FabZ [Desulfoglaeba alkanexedens]MDY6909433.1 3-hydroxyacyl-ACP dehydratase FabZ [Thermodesulfobacteriota bacterium]QCQ23014.1 3-hydroxyacyl-ACP dehydratase FabZ [Desulfoglaeba alkanexedens ALDC]